MKYNYLVFGGGRQGKAVIYDLFKNCEANMITVVEPDPIVRKQLDEFFQNEKLYLFDNILHMGISDSYIILNCAPYHTTLDIAAFAIKHKIPYVDLGGNPDMVNKLKEFSNQHNKDGISIVPDCGVAPGIANILAVDLAKQGYKDDIEVRCGGLVVARNKWDYHLLFSAEGLVSEYIGKVWSINDGELDDWPALSNHNPDNYLGYECRPTSNIGKYSIEYLRSLGVQNYDYQTMRSSRHWHVLESWKYLGYLKEDPIKNQELINCLKNTDCFQWHKNIFNSMHLYVGGTKGGYYKLQENKDYTIDINGNKNFTGLELMTSWGITIVAYMLLEFEKISEGFILPEQMIESNWFIEHLGDRLDQHDSQAIFNFDEEKEGEAE